MSFWYKKNIISYLLYPLSLIYGAISWLNIALRARGGYNSKAFVISVGNINIGGTGKTPLTIALANYLQESGKTVAVIGHGYKSTLENSEIVDKSFSVEQVGDEAVQMLSELNPEIMLVVGKNRLESIKFADEKGADIIILDDAYSATYIKRDCNIVVVDGKTQFGNKFVLPAGPLREPICGLKRADCMVVINRHKSLDINFDDDIFYLKTKINYSNKIKTSSLFAFCGLGLPSKFYNSLNKEGLGLKDCKTFPDHHKYTDNEIESIISKAKNNKLQVVTTLKDMVKINDKFSKDIEVIMLKLELTKTFKAFIDTKINNFSNKS